jgi:hypothetical protein
MKTRMRLPSGHSKRARQASAVVQSGIYQLKVVLAGSKPPIWRRIQVPGRSTLAALHHVLQRTMGWDDDHLHEFVVGDVSYGKPAREDDLFVPKMLDESRVKLKDVIPTAGKSFRYIYDFGDDWIHDIKVEKVLIPDEGVSYPLCLEGENACPPEDSGGIYGYYEKLEIIKDRNHPDYEDIIDWLGRRFDPSFFNLEAINRSLRKLSKE